MRTSQSAWVLALASLLLLLGLALGEIRLLALVLPLATYLALGAALRPPPPRLDVRREVDREVAVEGDRGAVTLRIKNEGPALELLELRDRVPPELPVVEGSNYLVTQLLPGESQSVRYEVDLRVKGKHQVGPLVARSRDLLGLHVHEVAPEEPVTLTVSPRGEDLGRRVLPARHTRPWLGQIPARNPGFGTDFWSIREYVSGDTLRRINWKTTARLDALHTNEFEGERSADYVLILDAREEAARGPVGQTTVEMGVRAARSLADVLLEDRNRVGLIIMRSVLDWVYPAFGKRQLHRIVDALVKVQPGGEWTLRHLPWVLDRFFPRQSQLVVITPLVDRSTRNSVAEMRVRGHGVLVLSPSPVELEADLLGEEDPRVRVARDLLRLERRADVARLRRFAPVVDWKPGEPLALALKEVEVRRRVPAR